MTKQSAIAALVAALMLGAAPAASVAQSKASGGVTSAQQGARSMGGQGMQTEPNDAVGAINKSKSDSNDPGVQVRCPSKGSNAMEKNGTNAARSAANCK
jgi:hypothetical protein